VLDAEPVIRGGTLSERLFVRIDCQTVSAVADGVGADLEPGFHAVWVKNVSGQIPLDVLEGELGRRP